MKTIKSLTMIITLLLSAFAFAADENALVAIGGYDPVAYFNDNEAVRGSGMHVADHKGKSYLFASAKNLEEFKKNPAKYEPQFGGYCAFGVAKGKKFYADPTVFAVVDGKLYLNLNKEIQSQWNAERPEMIKAAYMNWQKIRTKKLTSL